MGIGIGKTQHVYSPHKIKHMNLSLKELNDLYYCVGLVRLNNDVKMISNDELDALLNKLGDEISNEASQD